MKRTVILTAVACGLAAGAGCTRTDATREAREMASDVRTAAAAAGERIADSWLTARVQARVFADDDVKARDIDVSSRDGAVTLQGVVESDALRRRVIALARGVDGVERIEDRLLVGQAPAERSGDTTATAPGPVPTTGSEAAPAGDEHAPDDAMVTSLIQARYFVDPGLKMRNIEVATSNRVVTLRGEVASDDERARALLLARTTAGVERVEDGLSIDASLTVPGSGTAGDAGSLPAEPIEGAPIAPPPGTG